MLSNFGRNVDQMSEIDGENGYIDAAFERLVRSIATCILRTRDAIDRAAPRLEIMGCFKDLCREVRKAKMDFRRVVRFYGSTYQDCAARFVELVHEAAEISIDFDYPEVRKALQRHADEVDSGQAQMKSAA